MVSKMYIQMDDKLNQYQLISAVGVKSIQTYSELHKWKQIVASKPHKHIPHLKNVSLDYTYKY